MGLLLEPYSVNRAKKLSIVVSAVACLATCAFLFILSLLCFFFFFFFRRGSTVSCRLWLCLLPCRQLAPLAVGQ